MTAPPESLAPAVSDSRDNFVVRHWRLILLSFVGWSLLAAIPTTSAYLGGGAPGLGVWWATFKKIGLYYYLWGLLTPFLYRMTDALPYRGSRLPMAIAAHLLVLATLSFALGFITHPEAWRDWLFGDRAAGYHAMSAFTYALIVLCSLAIKFYRLSLIRQREATDARLLAAELDSKLNLARVDSLRMQMNPHFLFNALNGIAALVDAGRREEAYEAVEQLADLLRRALRLSAETTVTLDEELRFIEAYLGLERTRFGDRLNVAWHIGEGARSENVPAFVMQPLVENAIRHAVSQSADVVTVSIGAKVEQDALRLTVSDDAPQGGSPRTSKGTGLGLSNLRKRVELLYGSDAAVTADGTPNGFTAAVQIPLHDNTTVGAN